jgi:hypothetical protein
LFVVYVFIILCLLSMLCLHYWPLAGNPPVISDHICHNLFVQFNVFTT